MTPLVAFNTSHIPHLDTKWLISDIHIILSIFFSRGDFLPFKFVFSLSFLLFSFLFLCSRWGLIHEIKTILHTLITHKQSVIIGFLFFKILLH